MTIFQFRIEGAFDQEILEQIRWAAHRDSEFGKHLVSVALLAPVSDFNLDRLVIETHDIGAREFEGVRKALREIPPLKKRRVRFEAYEVVGQCLLGENGQRGKGNKKG